MARRQNLPAQNASEQSDYRISILDSFMTSTHRDVDKIIPTHKDVLERDPLFYGHLAVWAKDNIGIRDQHEVFMAHLFTSNLSEHREAAYCMLDSFPPYQVDRIIDHLKERMKKNPPRIMRNCVQNYLASRERNHDGFDSLAIRQRKALTSLYARFRLKPGERAQKILFDRKPPEDSRAFQLQKIAAEADPNKQAEMIVRNRIPYPVAAGIIKNMTPAVVAALVDSMSPQELLSNMGSLQKRGALDNPDIKKMVEDKISKAKSAKRVDALKGKKSADVAKVSEDIKKKLEEVADTRLKARAIKRSTALLIDKSGSMEHAIASGKQLGALISSVIEADFFCYAFDIMPYQISLKSDKLSDWERALQHIKAGGGTSIGSGVAAMTKANQKVEQIVVITDQGENRNPLFEDALKEYMDKLKVTPDVVVVLVPGEHGVAVEAACQNLKVNCDKITAPQDVDYYSMPDLLTLLSRKSRFDLLLEIMSTPLPTRNGKKVA